MTGKYPLLESITTPAQLRQLGPARLKELCRELRGYLLDSVSTTGGHLAAGLGAVELTVALHYVFNTPHDRLVWDVGHQCYPHKILTGRRERMHTMRKHGGLSGFPKRAESEYDTFGVGHSSTSISAALGMALAAEVLGEPRKVVAIIGDGGMSAGEAFEALNHAGDTKTDLLVILNDNDMSISENVGALSSYLTRVLSSRLAQSIRDEGKRALDFMPRPMADFARRAEEHVKGMVAPGTLFEELGFNYFGPVDGHDVDSLVGTLGNLASRGGPRLLHIVTRKGKGYGPAEDDPIGYHGVTPFDPEQGLAKSSGGAQSPSYTQVFGDWICDMAELDPKLVAITPAMREGSGLVKYQQRFPDRYHDVAIAEQHAVTLAAGLAADGAHPVCAIYSTFLQRGYDQLVHDVALQNLPVLFAIDRAGLVGPDGPTHAGSFDLSFMRCLPNMVIMAPADENECRQMLYTGHLHDGPAAVRYPRGKGPGVAVEPGLHTLPIGKGEWRRKGKEVALLGFGSMVSVAESLAGEYGYSAVNMRFVKPLDRELVLAVAETHRMLITLEENSIAGGAGAGVSELLAEAGIDIPVRHIGLADRYIEHGSREEMLADAGLDIDSVRRRIAAWTDQRNDTVVKLV